MSLFITRVLDGDYFHRGRLGCSSDFEKDPYFFGSVKVTNEVSLWFALLDRFTSIYSSGVSYHNTWRRRQDELVRELTMGFVVEIIILSDASLELLGGEGRF